MRMLYMIVILTLSLTSYASNTIAGCSSIDCVGQEETVKVNPKEAEICPIPVENKLIDLCGSGTCTPNMEAIRADKCLSTLYIELQKRFNSSTRTDKEIKAFRAGLDYLTTNVAISDLKTALYTKLQGYTLSPSPIGASSSSSSIVETSSNNFLLQAIIQDRSKGDPNYSEGEGDSFGKGLCGITPKVAKKRKYISNTSELFNPEKNKEVCLRMLEGNTPIEKLYTFYGRTKKNYVDSVVYPMYARLANIHTTPEPSQGTTNSPQSLKEAILKTINPALVQAIIDTVSKGDPNYKEAQGENYGWGLCGITPVVAKKRGYISNAEELLNATKNIEVCSLMLDGKTIYEMLMKFFGKKKASLVDNEVLPKYLKYVKEGLTF